MPSSFAGIFKSDVPSGDVGAPRGTTGVLSCAAGSASTHPTLHYWVADSACIDDAISAVRRIGYTDVHFTAFSDRRSWTRAYGVIAPLTNLDIIPASPANNNNHGPRRARTTPHHTPGDVPPPPSEPHPDDLRALLEASAGASVPRRSINDGGQEGEQPSPLLTERFRGVQDSAASPERGADLERDRTDANGGDIVGRMGAAIRRMTAKASSNAGRPAPRTSFK